MQIRRKKLKRYFISFTFLFHPVKVLFFTSPPDLINSTACHHPERSHAKLSRGAIRAG